MNKQSKKIDKDLFNSISWGFPIDSNNTEKTSEINLIKENVKGPSAFYSYATIISIFLALGIIALFEFLF